MNDPTCHAVLDQIEGEYEQLRGHRCVLCRHWVQVLPGHSLEDVHELGDESVNEASVVDAGSFEHHQGPEQAGGGGVGSLLVVGKTLVDHLGHPVKSQNI